MNSRIITKKNTSDPEIGGFPTKSVLKSFGFASSIRQPQS